MTEGEFKKAMSCWVTGVSVVTTGSGRALHGSTLNAFSSLSLSPMLCLICLKTNGGTCHAIQENGVFAVNMLSSGQTAIARTFASPEQPEGRFAGLDYYFGATGSPFLDGAIANLDCRLVNSMSSGDHTILVGGVERIITADLPPLGYFQGRFGQFAPMPVY